MFLKPGNQPQRRGNKLAERKGPLSEKLSEFRGILGATLGIDKQKTMQSNIGDKEEQIQKTPLRASLLHPRFQVLTGMEDAFEPCLQGIWVCEPQCQSSYPAEVRK